MTVSTAVREASTPTPARIPWSLDGLASWRSARRVTRRREALARAQTRGEYRPDLDGVRGAAAIMVMGYHAKVPGFTGAYIGLDLFFVVSGFVITGLLMHEYTKTGGIKWGAFYARRIRRLIPAKATMLLGVLVLSYLVMTPTGAQQETAKSAAAAAGFVSNIFFLNNENVDYFSHQPGTGVLLHTWSLSVEEQFYLAVPIAILLAVLLGRLLRVPPVRTLLFTTVVLALGSAALAINWSTSHPDASYYLPITRAFEFLMGVALALVVRKLTLHVDVRELMGLAGAAIIAFVLWRPMPVDGYPSYWALLPCTATVLIIWAGVGSPTVISRFLSWRFLVGLGLVSYGWYLWHWPLLVMGESINLAPPPLWARVLLIMVALGIAGLSYRYVEGIFYRRSGTVTTKRSYGPRRVILTGVVAMSSVAALAGGALVVADQRADSTTWAAVSAELDDVPQMPSECLQGDDIIPSKGTRCDLVPFEEDRPTVVLWGDSHAWMLIPALEAAAADQDVNLVAFVMGTCPPYDPSDALSLACTRSNRLALNFVRDLSDGDQPSRVVLSAAWPTYRGAPSTTLAEERAGAPEGESYVDLIGGVFEEQASSLFDKLGSFDVPVDVVGPTAFLTRNAPLCEAQARPYSCDLARDQAIPEEQENVEWLRDEMSGLAASSRFVDITGDLCDSTTCYAEIGDTVPYFDDNHLSAAFAARLEPYFVPTVRSVT